MVKKGQKKSILSSALITVFIVIMLILSGPAQAVSVIISGLGGTYTKGNSIEFTVSVNITDPDKYVPAANISLDITGPVNLDRTFALDGTPMPGGDPVITIVPVSTPQPDQFGYGYGYGVDSVGYGYGYHFGYGYGYGYGYGAGGGTVTYTYNVTINSASLPAGSYTAIAKLNTGKAALPSFNSASAIFKIAATPDPVIISWGNSKTGDATLNITVNRSETVRFNATADQIITEWEWEVDNDEQDNNFDNLSYRFDTVGNYEVEVEAKNDNGTSDEITWTIDVKDNPSGDTTPPGSISGLHNISYAPDYINWTWTDPTDTDFSKVIVSIDGGSTFDVLKGTEIYNATGFAPDTEHTISTRTVDTSGNINETWVNRTDRTAPTSPASPIQVAIEINPKTINPNSSGVITVSVLNNTPAGFDVDNVNISTVKFGPNGTAPVWNKSADKKLMLKFNTNDTGIQCGDTQANLTGKTNDGRDITGSDSIRTTGCTIDVPLSTDASGRTNTTVTKESPSGDLTVTIPAGTRALKSDGTPLSSITITSLTDLPSKASKKLSSKDKPVGEFVELGPSGSTFVPPIQIRFNYTEPLPSGVSESSLQIRTYNATTDSWETLSIVERNTESNYIIANVSHFSTFALIGTVSEAPSSGPSGTGGSSGGGGVITQEPYENIAKAETQEMDLIAGKPVLYIFTTPELGVYEQVVTGRESENDIAIRVEALKGTSKLVTSPAPGAVYKNVNIWAGTKRMKDAAIRFKVDNSWLDSNNLATGDTKMAKWDGNKWILLDTAETGKDASYTYLEAKTDTFSIFAITGLKGGVLPTATPTVTWQPEATSTGTDTATGTATTTPTPTSEAPPVSLATIMFVIVLIAIVTVVYLKRKEIFK